VPEPTDGETPGAERVSVGAPISWATVGTYLFFVLLLLLATRVRQVSTFPFINEVLAGLFAVFLARYLSTHYWLDADRLLAWRLFGSRSVRLEQIRRIQYGNIRELSPVSFFGSWGWRGRMWSPFIGRFDSVYTVSEGLVVTAGATPLFISPRDPTRFARELSRRVRSYTGPLEVDVGAPPGVSPGQ